MPKKPYIDAMLTPEICVAGRALVKITQDELAKASGRGKSTIRDFERGERLPKKETVDDIIAALKSYGVSIVRDRNSHGVVKALK